MNLLKKKSIGIIACPGGRVFASKIIEELDRIFINIENEIIESICQGEDV